MAIPKNIARDLAQAEQLQAQLAGLTVPGSNTATPPAQAPVPAPAPVAPAPPAQAPVPAPAPATPPPAALPVPPVDTSANSIDPRMAAMLQMMQRTADQNAELQRQLTAALAPKAPPPPPPADPNQVNPKDGDVFGADLVRFVQGKIHEAMTKVYADFNRAASQLDGRLKSVEQAFNSIDERVETTREITFEQALTMGVPDWKAINASQGWLLWLRENDPIFGTTRQAALDTASKSGEVDRVIAIFNAYKKTTAPAPAPAAATNDMAALVAPTVVSGAPPAQQQETPFVKASEIHSFYNEFAKGKWRGRESEASAKDAYIQRAVAAGRVMPG